MLVSDFQTHCFQLVCGTTLACLLWRFLLSLLGLLFFLNFPQCLALPSFLKLRALLSFLQCLALLLFPEVLFDLSFPLFLGVHSSQGVLSALCLLLDPAFLVILYHQFVLLDLPFPGVPVARGRPALPVYHLIQEYKGNPAEIAESKDYY